MKILITDIQYNLILESINNIDDFYDLLFENIYFVFESIKNKTKIKFKYINPIQYKKALDEFVTYKTFVRFPVKYIFHWKDIVLYDISLLKSLTEIQGHSSDFPFDEFYDVFDIPKEKRNNSFSDACDILYDEYNTDDYIPIFSNGQPVLTDYGLNPLLRLARELIEQDNPEDIIVTINKILDVAHQRSDLSELFLQGGKKSHDYISNI